MLSLISWRGGLPGGGALEGGDRVAPAPLPRRPALRRRAQQHDNETVIPPVEQSRSDWRRSRPQLQ